MTNKSNMTMVCIFTVLIPRGNNASHWTGRIVKKSEPIDKIAKLLHYKKIVLV